MLSSIQERDHAEHDSRRDPGRRNTFSGISLSHPHFKVADPQALSFLSPPCTCTSSGPWSALTGQSRTRKPISAALSPAHLPSVSSTGTPTPRRHAPQTCGLGCSSQRHSTGEGYFPSAAGEPSLSLSHCWKAMARKGKATDYSRENQLSVELLKMDFFPKENKLDDWRSQPIWGKFSPIPQVDHLLSFCIYITFSLHMEGTTASKKDKAKPHAQRRTF